MRGPARATTAKPRRPRVRDVHQVGNQSGREPSHLSGWVELVVLFALSAALATVVVVTSAPANPRPGSTQTAVLIRGESTSLGCDEGVARVGAATWVNQNENLDRVRLPLRGRLHVVDGAAAVFTAHGIRVNLAPAMPCTAG